MRKLASDIMYCAQQGWLSNKVIVIDDQGFILDLQDRSECHPGEYSYYPGMLVPGFVNAHCHLELSHLFGKFQTGTQLLAFLKSVVENRALDIEFVFHCIKQADLEMQREGIIAVGDISNKSDTLNCKLESPIHYYTFVEAFDFLQESLTDGFFNSYKVVYDSFGSLPKSMVPHAPYSVSPKLFNAINDLNKSGRNILSIHNQECKDEDQLFQTKSGGFVAFWESFGFAMEQFTPIGKDSIDYTLKHMDSLQPTLFVHNTQTKQSHVRAILNWNPNSFFVTCPNANLFIENQLPDYSQFKEAKLCIGTDSLCSNWQLSILAEIKTLLKYNSYLSLDEVLRWATLNGAQALNISNWAGSLELGKKPGLNWIQSVYFKDGNWNLKSDSKIFKII